MSPREEVLSAAAADPVEAAEESGLRPRRLNEFVGQLQLKEHLDIVLEAGMPICQLIFEWVDGTQAGDWQ